MYIRIRAGFLFVCRLAPRCKIGRSAGSALPALVGWGIGRAIDPPLTPLARLARRQFAPPRGAATNARLAQAAKLGPTIGPRSRPTNHWESASDENIQCKSTNYQNCSRARAASRTVARVRVWSAWQLQGDTARLPCRRSTQGRGDRPRETRVVSTCAVGDTSEKHAPRHVCPPLLLLCRREQQTSCYCFCSLRSVLWTFDLVLCVGWRIRWWWLTVEGQGRGRLTRSLRAPTVERARRW